MRRLSFLLPFLFLPITAHSQDLRVDSIDVVSKGIYDVQTGEETPDASAPTGEIAAPVTFKNIESTDEIPARVGVEFGAEYRVVGAPEGAKVPLELVITYPAPGLADPEEAEPVRTTRFTREKTIGEVTYVGYGFENDWELVPGTWTFRIFYDNRKLLEESFTVVK
jgi:Domain of unknown function (DUF3859)